MSKTSVLYGVSSARAQASQDSYEESTAKEVNVHAGSGGRYEGVSIPTTLSQQTGDNTSTTTSMVSTGRVRGTYFKSVCPSGAEAPECGEEWADREKHIINGLHPLLIIENPQGASKTINPIPVGSTLQLLTKWSPSRLNGSLETNGQYQSMRVNHHTPSSITGRDFPTTETKADTIKNKFGNNSGDPVPPPPNTPEEIVKLAAGYDTDDEVPNKEQHKSYFDILHPQFLPLVKAFAYRCWKELGAKLLLNSSYRSPEKQKSMRDKWDEAGEGSDYRKSHAKPAAPPEKGSDGKWVKDLGSNHNVGLAIDFNPSGGKLKKYNDGGGLFKKTPKDKGANKALWLDSGIVDIGESLGMKWGGHFKTNFDPIHFDLPLGPIHALLNKADDQGVDANKVQV